MEKEQLINLDIYKMFMQGEMLMRVDGISWVADSKKAKAKDRKEALAKKKELEEHGFVVLMTKGGWQ